MFNNITDMIHCTLLAHQTAVCVCTLNVVCCVSVCSDINMCVYLSVQTSSVLQNDKCNVCALHQNRVNLLLLFFAEATQRQTELPRGRNVLTELSQLFVNHKLVMTRKVVCWLSLTEVLLHLPQVNKNTRKFL